MVEYLKYFPKPFLDDIVGNRCVPFVGSGFSRNAALPPGAKMPLWDELARHLAALIPGYDYTEALDAISAFEHEYSRVKLVEELTRVLHVNSAQPGAAHRAFCDLPFQLVCTTNFDFLLERGYETTGRYCRPITDEDQLSVGGAGPVVHLLKFHGDLHHPKRLVLTEEDYSGFISRNPLLATFIANLMIANTALFVGYSLDDPDFRLLWQIVGDRLGKLRRPAYTIRVGSNQHDIARFERRGVRVINLPGSPAEYGEILEVAFKQLGEYWDNSTAQKTASIEDELLAELALPRDASTRICSFIVPREVQGFYRSRVFPLAERHGLTPVAVADVVAGGDSIIAKLTSLIDRAEYVVLDVSTRATMMEAGIVFARRVDGDKVLVIKDPHADLPLEWVARVQMIRPKDLSEDPDDFLKRLDEWLRAAAERLTPALSDEPRRLLEKKEHRAAVISAVALLEAFLRRMIVEPDEELRAINMTISSLLRVAQKRGLISVNDDRDIREWMHLRNRAVHQQGQVTAAAAKQAVNGTYALLQRLSGRTA